MFFSLLIFFFFQCCNFLFSLSRPVLYATGFVLLHFLYMSHSFFHSIFITFLSQYPPCTSLLSLVLMLLFFSLFFRNNSIIYFLRRVFLFPFPLTLFPFFFFKVAYLPSHSTPFSPLSLFFPLSTGTFSTSSSFSFS